MTSCEHFDSSAGARRTIALGRHSLARLICSPLSAVTAENIAFIVLGSALNARRMTAAIALDNVLLIAVMMAIRTAPPQSLASSLISGS
jgi:hypothetical protein